MPDEAKRKYVRLSPATWAEVDALWETGETTLEELSTGYGINTRSLQAHFEKFKIVKGSKASEILTAVKEVIYADFLDDRDVLIAKAKQSRANAFANAETIEGLVMTQIAEAQKDPSSAFKATGALKALTLAAQTLERTMKIKTAALGLDRMDDGTELPTITFIDLTEEEIKQHQSGDNDELDDDSASCAIPSANENDVIIIE
jgi:hypothetical protein